MNRKKISVLLCLLMLSGCISQEAREAFERARDEYAQVQTQAEAEMVAAGKVSQSMVSALKDAEVKMQATQWEMEHSRVVGTAEKLLGGVEKIGPLIGLVYQPAMQVLGTIQGVLSGFIANRKKKKVTLGATTA